MKKKYTFILCLFLTVISFNNSIAQMATQMTVSAEREIPYTFNTSPVKSIKIKNGMILSLIHYHNSYDIKESFFIDEDSLLFPDMLSVNSANPIYISQFILTMDNNSTIQNTSFPAVITNFDYDSIEKIIYFCGIKNDSNIIGKVSFDSLFNPNFNLLYSLHYITLNNPTSFLKKIVFYRTNEGEKKLSLIANDDINTNAKYGVHGLALVFPPSYYINYDVSSDTYQTFERSMVRLTDVIHTKDKIVIVGMRDMMLTELFVHEKDYPHVYVGRHINTDTLYTHFLDPQNKIAPLLNTDNTFILGTSVIHNGNSILKFTLFNVDYSITQLYSQIILPPNDYHYSKILDMKYNISNKSLYVLICNGTDSTQIKDEILQFQPYNISPHQAFATTPDNNSTVGYNLLNSLTLYNNNESYLVLGSKANINVSSNPNVNNMIGNLYFFDRNINNAILTNCGADKKLTVIPTNYTLYLNTPIEYNILGHNSSTQISIPVYHNNTSYQIDCN